MLLHSLNSFNYEIRNDIDEQILGSGEKTRVSRGTRNTQLIYLGLIQPLK